MKVLNRLSARALLICCLLCVCFGLRAENWTLAALPFEVSGPDSDKGAALAAGELLPQLILQQFAARRTRIPSPAEMEERALAAIRLEMQKLLLELSQAVKERDALVLLPEGDSSRSKKEAAVNKKIEEIRSKLDGFIRSSSEGLSGISSFRSFDSEAVSLWKADSSALLELPEGASSAPGSQALTAMAAEQKINGILSGSVRVYAGYVSVTVRLTVYPGARPAAAVTEVGSLSDLVHVAESCAVRLMPYVLNQIPVHMYFNVSPPEAAAAAKLIVDTDMYAQLPDKITTGGGIHSLTVEAPGYLTRSFSWDFSGASEFRVDIEMPPAHPRDISLALKVPKPGKFWLQGLPAEEPVTVHINGSPILGLFVPEQGNPGFFYVSDRLDVSAAVVNPILDDLSFKIETKRKWMYTSYTAFILSLPAAFFCYGTYVDKHNNWALGHTDGRDIKGWQIASGVAIGVSAALGINFLVQLGIYLYNVDKVLPPAAVPDPAEAVPDAGEGDNG